MPLARDCQTYLACGPTVDLFLLFVLKVFDTSLNHFCGPRCAGGPIVFARHTPPTTAQPVPQKWETPTWTCWLVRVLGPPFLPMMLLAQAVCSSVISESGCSTPCQRSKCPCLCPLQGQINACLSDRAMQQASASQIPVLLQVCGVLYFTGKVGPLQELVHTVDIRNAMWLCRG